MKNDIIVEGNSMEEVIEKGLKDLNVKICDADIEIIQEGKSVLGIVTKPWKVKLTKKINTDDICTNTESSKNGTYQIKQVDDKVYLTIFPSEGSGESVCLQEIIYELEKNEIYNVDKNALDRLIHSKEYCSIDIEELKFKEPEDARVQVELTKDEMKAYATIIPPKGGKMVTLDTFKKILKDNNIVYGVIHNTIEKMINDGEFYEKQLVAAGKTPIDGKDGQIKYLFNTEIIVKPKMLEGGKVDFKELNIIENVKKGEYLAEKILPTKGVDGITVTGKVVKAKSGKPVNFKRGKNVIESEDGLKLIAEVDGCPKLIDDKISVFEVYEVNGNVDNSTGNIYFCGKVVVRGNVRSGFKIESDGDVEVFGVVEGATIIAGGNIILHKGIQGHNTGKLISKQNIFAKYMENCYAKANGNINAEVVLHCFLESKNSIFISGKKGIITGGEIRANQEVNAITIGSPMSTITKIEVGIDPDLKQKFESLKQELEVLNKNKENVVKAIELLTKMAKITNLPDEKKNMLLKSLHTKKYLDEKINHVNESLSKLRTIMQTLSQGRINVLNTVYSGVRISIGDAVYHVRDELKNSTIIKENGEIKILPYLGK